LEKASVQFVQRFSQFAGFVERVWQGTTVASKIMWPRFLSQKIAQKEPEKKISSRSANAMRHSAKVA
jgi:hypothetical protein